VLEEGAAKGIVAGNIVLGGQRAGIVVRNGSSGVRIARNIIWHRDGAGILTVGGRADLVTVAAFATAANDHDPQGTPDDPPYPDRAGICPAVAGAAGRTESDTGHPADTTSRQISVKVTPV